MAWFRKKPDPISDRARALNDQIAALEAEIQALDSQVVQDQSQPRLRSTAMPRGNPTAASPPAAGEPVFEELGADRLKANADAPSTSDHYNELGVRKYDFAALLKRIGNHFRGPSTTNPKLVSYLAAGGIQGLRPLRYEKRVARNRVIGMVLLLFLILLGIVAWIRR